MRKNKQQTNDTGDNGNNGDAVMVFRKIVTLLKMMMMMVWIR